MLLPVGMLVFLVTCSAITINGLQSRIIYLFRMSWDFIYISYSPLQKSGVLVVSFDLRLGSATILSYRSIALMVCLNISVKPSLIIEVASACLTLNHDSLCLGNNNGTQTSTHLRGLWHIGSCLFTPVGHYSRLFTAVGCYSPSSRRY